MKVTGSSHFAADRQAVWQALNDPAVLVRTIPGCQQLEALGGDAYKMRISAGVGSIKGVYDGEVRLTDQVEPGSFHMHAQGAGAPGTIGADVSVTLADGADGGTDLTYDADATVGGMIGGVGQRMLTGVSKKMAAEFFGNVDALLVGAAAGLVAASHDGRTGEGAATDGRTGEGAPTVDGPGSRATEERGRMGGAPSPGSPAAATTAGQVFTAPAAPAAAGSGLDLGFVVGVAVGAAAALAGALVGGWLSRRRN